MAFNRRDFVKAAAVTLAAAPGAGANSEEPATQVAAPTSEKIFNAIQVGPYTVLDEGIDHALDLMQSDRGVNALFMYSHTYNGDFRKAVPTLADDHGVAPHDNRNRRLPFVWVKHHEQFFKNTSLRNQVVDNTFDYADRDVFKEIVEPARKRGMKMYARILEGTNLGRAIANYPKVVTIDHTGKPTGVACWNHPEYIAFWTATVDDMFRNYELDGLQWGAERAGPLTNTIVPWNNTPAACFCPHCLARAKEHNIDAERARHGYQQLYEYVQGLMAGTAQHTDGVFVGLLRILLRYPEILSWEYQYRLSREEMLKAIYDQVKQVKPTAQVGWHVDHEPSTWDLIYRAEMSYAEMAPYSDFIKIILYHDVAAPRVRNWYLERLRRGVLQRSAAGGIAEPVLRPVRLRQIGRAEAERNDQPRIFAGIRVPRNAAQRRLGGGQNENLLRHRLQRARRAAEYRSGKCLQGRAARLRRRRRRHRDLARIRRNALPNLNAVGRAVRDLAGKQG